MVIIITKENKSLQMGKWWRGARRSSGLIFRAQDWWGCQLYRGSNYYLTDVVEVDLIIRMSWQCLDSEARCCSDGVHWVGLSKQYGHQCVSQKHFQEIKVIKSQTRSCSSSIRVEVRGGEEAQRLQRWETCWKHKTKLNHSLRAPAIFSGHQSTRRKRDKFWEQKNLSLVVLNPPHHRVNRGWLSAVLWPRWAADKRYVSFLTFLLEGEGGRGAIT